MRKKIWERVVISEKIELRRGWRRPAAGEGKRCFVEDNVAGDDDSI
jgi:hypothetical protein